jgi:hypothetical protein
MKGLRRQARPLSAGDENYLRIATKANWARGALFQCEHYRPRHRISDAKPATKVVERIAE